MARDVATATGSSPAPLPASKLPASLRFPLVIILSLSISTLAYTTVADLTDRELSSVSRSLNEWWHPIAALAWRAITLAVAWYNNYDGTVISSSS
jgi:hypothetical protein